MSSPITVILADDHYLFRVGFKNLVSTEEEIQILSIATNGSSLMTQVSQQPPDVVIIAVHLPGGPEACGEIHKRYPQTRIMALGYASHEKEEAQMLLAGAGTVLNKTATMHQMVECIKQLHYAGDADKDGMVPPAAGAGQPFLNKNEIAVLQLLCLQMDSEEIGKKLFLSKHTIDHIRKALLQKCGVKNLAGLIMYAVRYGIVKVEEIKRG
jgi:DNA-binding NarL/FixJ family response regulator